MSVEPTRRLLYRGSQAALLKTIFIRTCEARQHDRHQNDHQIFYQRDADHDTAVSGAHGATIAEETDQNHRAGNGDRGANHDSLNQAPTNESGDEHRQPKQ